MPQIPLRTNMIFAWYCLIISSIAFPPLMHVSIFMIIPAVVDP